ncbi:hypothetical protein ACSNOK_29935 [Streptomyces sp. URMC 126]|uniref:hypothetical protein n=1 Tax=Streptomyces sp. URMC 126 TaxID=3423401 RepID=UPI003F1D4C99
MEKHPPQEPTVAAADTPTAKAGPVVVVRRWLVLAAVIGLVFWVSTAAPGFFEDLQGGRIRSAADYRTQDIRTREAGKTTVARLRPGSGKADGMRKEGSTSCVDDMGFDGDGVTRDQPHYVWPLDYAREADYLADLDKVRAAWREHGWEVRDTQEETDQDSPRRERRWPGIHTVADHGITLSMSPDRFTNKPTLSADGGCVRYREEQGVAARERSGAADSGSPARKGTLTYDDGVRVSIGPVRAVTPSPAGEGDAAPAAHAYSVPVTVTNGSGAPVELRSYDVGSYENANPGLRNPVPYSPELASSTPVRVAEGETTHLELVYSADKELSRLRFTFAPGEFHLPYQWALSIP